MGVQMKVSEAGSLTRLLVEAMARLEELPEDRQDQIARRLLDIVETDLRIASGELSLTPEQQAEVDVALAEDGPYVSDDEMKAFFDQYRH